MRWQAIRQKFGIKFDNNGIEKILYSAQSSSGFVLGVPSSKRHITVVNEGASISSHLTDTSFNTRQHIGRIQFSEIEKAAFEKFLIPRERAAEGFLNQQVLFLTDRFSDSFNNLERSIFKKQTRGKLDLSYLDLTEVQPSAIELFQQVAKAPEKFLGRSRVKELLANEEANIAFTEPGICLIKIEGRLYEVTLPFISNPDPYMNMFNNLGLHYVLEDILKTLGKMERKTLG